jgi:hypothetical protein
MWLEYDDYGPERPDLRWLVLQHIQHGEIARYCFQIDNEPIIREAQRYLTIAAWGFVQRSVPEDALEDSPKPRRGEAVN